jgi:flagellar hook-associated protein 1 FlgK
LANFIDRSLESQGGTSLSQLYDRLTSDVSQGSAVAQSTADGTKVFQQSLKGQSLAISGVSVDEETVNLIQYQRAFQAAAKYISTLSELLEMLVNL